MPSLNQTERRIAAKQRLSEIVERLDKALEKLEKLTESAELYMTEDDYKLIADTEAEVRNTATWMHWINEGYADLDDIIEAEILDVDEVKNKFSEYLAYHGRIVVEPLNIVSESEVKEALANIKNINVL